VKVIPGKQAKDNYGRLLAYIQKGDMDVNREMILQGKAVPYIIYPNFERVKPYLDSLKEAQKFSRGIWNPDDPLDELSYEFRLRVGHRQPDKYAGDYDTKEYVEPDQYKDIPIEQRVFFWNEEMQKKLGIRSNKKKPVQVSNLGGFLCVDRFSRSHRLLCNQFFTITSL